MYEDGQKTGSQISREGKVGRGVAQESDQNARISMQVDVWMSKMRKTKYKQIGERRGLAIVTVRRGLGTMRRDGGGSRTIQIRHRHPSLTTHTSATNALTHRRKKSSSIEVPHIFFNLRINFLENWKCHYTLQKYTIIGIHSTEANKNRPSRYSGIDVLNYPFFIQK